MSFDPVAQWAARTPSHLAVRQCHPADCAWTYAALHALVEGASTWLRAYGVGRQDRVAVLASNRVETLIVAFAAWRLGAIAVPLNWRLTPGELARLLEHAAPRVLLMDADHEALARDALARDALAHDALRHTREPMVATPLPSVNAFTATPAGHASISGVAEAEADADSDAADHADADEVAMLLYTSGSTGQPKAVCVSHRQLRANAEATIAGWGMSPEDRVLVATPLFHTAGWHALTTPVLAAGGTVVLDGDFEAERFMGTMQAEAITRTFVVPTQLLMAQRTSRWGMPLPALRQWLVGGAPCPRAARDDAQATGYPVVEAYGLTECGPNCFVLDPQVTALPPGTVGHPLPGLEARVVDEAEAPVARGTVGALQFRGAMVCAGYWEDPPASRALMAHDGWMRTGDLASVEADGRFRMAGRAKALFISGGEHVYPGEVERALREVEAIEEVVVVAVPDPWWGEVGCAVVTRRAPLDVDVLMRHARLALAGYKRPRYLLEIATWPTLGSGKIDRARVAELARAALAGEDSSMMAISQDAGRE